MEDSKVIMGRVASPYGVRGWTKVISFTDPIDNLLNYSSWQIKHRHAWQTIKIEKGKIHGKWLIVKFAGCDDRDVAKSYTNDLIAIERENLIPLKANEFYWSDLVGLKVVNLAGAELGHIESLFETGANDVIVVKDPNNRQILIPYIKQVVKSIDIKNKLMTVDWESNA